MISRSQLFCILLLSRLSAEVVFPYSSDFSGTSLAALIIAEVIRFVLAFPVLIYSLNGRDMYSAISNRSKVLAAAAGTVASFILAVFFARTALYTAEFAQRTLLGGMSGAVLLIIILLFALYTSAKGAEAFSRAGVLILIAAAAVTVVVMLADIPHVRIRASTGDSFGNRFVHLLIERLLSGGEYLVFAALMPYVNLKRDNKHRIGAVGFYFAAASVACTLLINIFGMGVLGEFYAVAEYPLIASSQLSDIALFKRLDGFVGAVWSLGAALRSGVLLFSCYAIIKYIIPSSKKKGEESV